MSSFAIDIDSDNLHVVDSMLAMRSVWYYNLECTVGFHIVLGLLWWTESVEFVGDVHINKCCNVDRICLRVVFGGFAASD